jgi:hypothetical protein
MPRVPSGWALLILLFGAGLGVAHRAMASPDEGKSLVLVPAPAAPARAVPCGRDCLKGFTDRYFAALRSRCPCGVALAPDVKYTENGQVVKPGEGIWKTFGGLGKYRVYLTDPAKGEAGYYGDFYEFNGALFGMMALRLRVQDQRITEIEIIVAREQLRPSGGLGANTAGIMTPRMIDELKPGGFIASDPILLQRSTAATRTPRNQMIAAVNRYFDGYEQSKDSIVPFADNCSRRENGFMVTNNTDGPVLDPAHPGFKVFGQGCSQELDGGFFSVLSKARDSRQLVVDEDHGVVLVLTLFDNEGDVKSVQMPGIGPVIVPPEFLRPITYLTPQLFKIENGKIRQIEGLSWPVPYGMRSGWDN